MLEVGPVQHFRVQAANVVRVVLTPDFLFGDRAFSLCTTPNFHTTAVAINIDPKNINIGGRTGPPDLK